MQAAGWRGVAALGLAQQELHAVVPDEVHRAVDGAVWVMHTGTSSAEVLAL